MCVTKSIKTSYIPVTVGYKRRAGFHSTSNLHRGFVKPNLTLKFSVSQEVARMNKDISS